jgi:NADPH-dependent curcumin reductase CurA
VDNPSKYPNFFLSRQYNFFQPFHQNLVEIVRKSISMYGFVVSRLLPKYGAQFYPEMTAQVVTGKIQHRQQIYDGLADSGEAIAAVQKGLNTAKAVVHVADE